MPTALIHSDRFADHDTGPGHPERPDRIRAINAALRSSDLWDQLIHLPFGPAPLEAVTAVHEPRYITRLQRAVADGEPYIDVPDSAISEASFEVALLATGGILAAVDAVMAGRATNAFCAVRPPGHHAESHRSMGFCLINHVAVAAQHLIARHGLSRVAIVDFDVHHGNGTQQIFESRNDVLFISLHEDPSYLYPGSGFDWETGRGAGEGFTINVPMHPGGGDEAYRHAFGATVEPALERFRPEFLLVSAGFDAARGDPLAHMNVTADGFEWMAERLCAAAAKHCGDRLVATLEGGYDLRNLRAGVTRVITAMLET